MQYSCFINGTDIKITLCVGNIIHQNNALVIPTNTTFDTIQDDEFISKTSVQGQFQEKYYRNNIRKLDNEICEGLRDQRPVTDTRRTHSKSNQYAIGTTCKITTHDQRHAYFLAIADINEKGKPINTKIENITDSLVSFWNFLNEEGHVETLAIPLIGTGKAGIKDATRDVIIKEIIFSFIAASKEMKVTEELLIYIHPSDFLKKNLHWHEMCEYLDYMCKFMTSDRTTLPVGEPDNNYARFA